MNEFSKQISEKLSFRRAEYCDVPAIGAILKAAVKRMLAEGKRQWDDSYPNETHVSADIDRGVGYVIECDGAPIAYGAVVFDGEPAYDALRGRWLSDGPYVVIHRLAVSQEMQGKGLGRLFMNCVADFARSKGVHSFKVDTNFDNFAMLHLLDRLGFTYCGEVQYSRGSRKAFEKPI
jgi:acetyltransferase (GNAT) family